MSDNSKRGENQEREISTPLPAPLSEQPADAQEMPAKRDAWRGGDNYEASMLRNLLAVIHRDGGHYVEDHGLDKAIDDAEAVVRDLFDTPRQFDVPLPPLRTALQMVRAWIAGESWHWHMSDGILAHIDEALAAPLTQGVVGDSSLASPHSAGSNSPNV